MVQDIKVENCHCYKFNKCFFLSGLNECVDFSLSGQWIHIYSFEIGKTLIKLITVAIQDIKVENCQCYKFNKRFFPFGTQWMCRLFFERPMNTHLFFWNRKNAY